MSPAAMAEEVVVSERVRRWTEDEKKNGVRRSGRERACMAVDHSRGACVAWAVWTSGGVGELRVKVTRLVNCEAR